MAQNYQEISFSMLLSFLMLILFAVSAPYGNGFALLTTQSTATWCKKPKTGSTLTTNHQENLKSVTYLSMANSVP
jgi:hypothetical protein